jgi:hypothetical protein
MPLNLMSWGVVVVGSGAVEQRSNKLHFCPFFGGFNSSFYIKHSIQLCMYIEYTEFKLTL